MGIYCLGKVGHVKLPTLSSLWAKGFMRRIVVLLMWFISLGLGRAAYGQMSVEDAMATYASGKPPAPPEPPLSPPRSLPPAQLKRWIYLPRRKPWNLPWTKNLAAPSAPCSRRPSYRNGSTSAPVTRRNWQKLVNTQASAKIIVESIHTNGSEITVFGHLFPPAKDSTMTDANVARLRPSQIQSSQADMEVMQMQEQLRAANARRDAAMADLNDATINYPSQSMRISQDRQTIDQATTEANSLQIQLPLAQQRASEARTTFNKTQQQIMQNGRADLQRWGPITLRTRDPEMLNKLPGYIFTIAPASAAFQLWHSERRIERAGNSPATRETLGKLICRHRPIPSGPGALPAFAQTSVSFGLR